jgi:phosphatidylglycerophosphate synthase
MTASARREVVGVVVDPDRDGAATDVVAGLPLALRALLELSRAGVDELVLALGDASLGPALLDDPRAPKGVVVAEVSSLEDALRIAEDRPAVIAPAGVVAERDVYRALADAAGRGEAAHAVSEGEGEGPFVHLPSAPSVQVEVGWVIRADTAANRRRIVDHLFDACRKPVDGIVSRHLNRHVSIFVSKRIVDTAISPNTITVLTLFLGIAAALAAARATYLWMVIGAALLQLNSILDGVDGELARVRFQHSKLGQWLDTICDDLANTMFYAGTTYAAFQLPALPAWIPWCGVGGVVGSLLTMTMYYAELYRLGSGDFYSLDVGQDEERSGLWGAINRGARYVTKRDFFVFSFLVAAVLGVLPYVLPVVAAGTLATVVTGLRITLARFRSATSAGG